MHTGRNRAEHDKRRRMWSPGFSDKALRDYEVRMRPYGAELQQRLAVVEGQSLDASKWFNYYSFDAMGDLALFESFQMLQRGQQH